MASMLAFSITSFVAASAFPFPFPLPLPLPLGSLVSELLLPRPEPNKAEALNQPLRVSDVTFVPAF